LFEHKKDKVLKETVFFVENKARDFVACLKNASLLVPAIFLSQDEIFRNSPLLMGRRVLKS